MSDPFRNAAILSGTKRLSLIKKAVKALERGIESADDTTVKISYLSSVLLENYIKKRLPIDCVAALAEMEKNGQRKDGHVRSITREKETD